MQIINLTPHDVVVVLASGERKTYPRSGNVARVSEQKTQIAEIDGVPLISMQYSQDCELPPQQDGVGYIVSLLVAQTIHRTDLLVVADTVRDDKGQIVGCRAFATLAPAEYVDCGPFIEQLPGVRI